MILSQLLNKQHHLIIILETAHFMNSHYIRISKTFVTHLRKTSHKSHTAVWQQRPRKVIRVNFMQFYFFVTMNSRKIHCCICISTCRQTIAVNTYAGLCRKNQTKATGSLCNSFVCLAHAFQQTLLHFCIHFESFVASISQLMKTRKRVDLLNWWQTIQNP